jgi:hypothetical protein
MRCSAVPPRAGMIAAPMLLLRRQADAVSTLAGWRRAR